MLIAMYCCKAAVAQEVILEPTQENYFMPMDEQNPKAWAMSRLKRISGHKVGGYFGGGIIPSSGYSPWTKGNPGDGLSWQLEYEWIPSKPAYANFFGMPLTVGLGAIYTGFRSKGEDLVYRDGAELNPHMSLLLNYLGVEGTLKLLTRSDKWTVNLRLSIGAMASAFHADVRTQSTYYEPFSFDATKFGFASAGRFNIEYNLSRYVSISPSITTVRGFISHPLHKADFDFYPEWPYKSSSWILWFNWTLGVTYRF